jgi:hypothetical protein
MKLLTVQLPPFSCHFIPLLFKYCSHNPVLKHSLNICSSLNVRDQVSHPYNTTGRTIVLRVLTFTFLDNRREDRKKTLDRMVASIPRIYISHCRDECKSTFHVNPLGGNRVLLTYYFRRLYDFCLRTECCGEYLNLRTAGHLKRLLESSIICTLSKYYYNDIMKVDIDKACNTI